MCIILKYGFHLLPLNDFKLDFRIFVLSRRCASICMLVIDWMILISCQLIWKRRLRSTDASTAWNAKEFDFNSPEDLNANKHLIVLIFHICRINPINNILSPKNGLRVLMNSNSFLTLTCNVMHNFMKGSHYESGQRKSLRWFSFLVILPGTPNLYSP